MGASAGYEVPYSVHTIDLGALVANPQLLVQIGLEISSVTVVSLSIGASFNLHFGSSRAIPVIAQGTQYKPRPRPVGDRCVFPNRGLYYSVTTTSVGQAVILVTYGEDGLLEITGAGAPSISIPIPGFIAAQAIPATGPAAPYHHFALMRNPPAPNTRIIKLRRWALSIGAALHKAQINTVLETGAIASTTALVQKNNALLVDTNVADFWTDPGNSTNGAGPARFSKSGIGTALVELIGPNEPPIRLAPGDVAQVDETDSTTSPGFVMYEYDQE